MPSMMGLAARSAVDQDPGLRTKVEIQGNFRKMDLLKLVDQSELTVLIPLTACGFRYSLGFRPPFDVSLMMF